MSNLLDSHGRPLPPSPRRLVDALDGYSPTPLEHPTPELRAALESEAGRAREGVRLDAAGMRGVDMDGIVNELTGIGDFTADKTMGGRPGGAVWQIVRLSGIDAETRQRASDLGNNIVEKIPDEMTREGWTVQVQPTEGETDLEPADKLAASLREPKRAAAGWRSIGARGDRSFRVRCETLARRWDDWPTQINPPAAPPPPPGPLPKLNDEGLELGAAMDEAAEELDVLGSFNAALKFERCFGGGAIFIGADDGETDLTKPLREDRIRSIKHLTPYFGGWDGEVIAWRYYTDPSKKNYGKPEIYQVRNVGVPLSRAPAPGETSPVSQVIPQMGSSGPMIWYVHESRFLVFDGEPSSRRTRVEMRGWGDSVFTRANTVLSQYEQAWGGLAILLQELSICTLKIPGLIEMLASADPKRQGLIAQRAQMLQLTTAITRARLIDAEEEFDRKTAALTGAPELMREFGLRLSAAVDMPVAMLFGQVQGGLGNAAAGDIRFFYDKIAAKQRKRMLPLLKRLTRMMWLAKDSPSRGVLPERWSIVLRPLWQMSATEKADHRLKVTQADEICINTGQATAEEIVATRYGGADFDDGPIVLDMEGRKKLADLQPLPELEPPTPGAELPPRAAGPPSAPTGAQQVESGTSTESSKTGGHAIDPAAPVPSKPMQLESADPASGDPSANPSTPAPAPKQKP